MNSQKLMSVDKIWNCSCSVATIIIHSSEFNEKIWKFIWRFEDYDSDKKGQSKNNYKNSTSHRKSKYTFSFPLTVVLYFSAHFDCLLIYRVILYIYSNRKFLKSKKTLFSSTIFSIQHKQNDIIVWSFNNELCRTGIWNYNRIVSIINSILRNLRNELVCERNT